MQAEHHALILFAHGARDPAWAEPMRDVQALICAQSPNTPVSLAFLEFISPTLDLCVDALVEQGVRRITILPMFMAAGGHLIKDLPNLVAAIQLKYPMLDFEIKPPVGVLPAVQQAMADCALAWLKP